MKTFFVVLVSVTFAGLCVAEPNNTVVQGVVVSACSGQVDSWSDASGRWTPVMPGAELGEGSTVRTSSNGAADLQLQYNGSVFRLPSESELRIEKLHRADTGLGMVTDTRLNVIQGSLIGSQRKLHTPSVLQIHTAQGEAVIRGTEYIVTAQGAVSVLSGLVEVNYTLPTTNGSGKAKIPAGSSFNPATGTVMPTTAYVLLSTAADVNAVRKNAIGGRTIDPTVVKKPNDGMSPTKPKGNNGVGNGVDPQPPGNPPVNDGPGNSPGNPGNKGGSKK